MSDYKRWTDKNWKQFDCSEMYKAFAELEDKLENGTLVELEKPYMKPVGDDKYIIWTTKIVCLSDVLTKAEAEANLEELKRGSNETN